MITFDKLKLVANIEAIDILDEDRFQMQIESGRKVALKFFQEVPFLLMIKVDYLEQEVVVEFCGKVLGKDYPKLISADTIRTCFDNINDMGFCHIDVEAMMDADVVKADVTKDVRGIETERLTKYLGSHISNYKLYVTRNIRNGNLVIEKNVISRKTKKRMTIYDKAKEMDKAKNRSFVEVYQLQNAFDNTSRFELNLNSKEQVRDALHLTDNRLKNVLTSTASPIREFVEKVIEPASSPVPLSDKKSYLTNLVLKDCDYDLEKVEAKMREFYPPRGTNFKKLMEPYRTMMYQMTNDENVNFYTDLLERLT